MNIRMNTRTITLVMLAVLVLAGLACGSEKTVLSPTMPATTEVEATEAPMSKEVPTEAPEPTETPKPVMAAEILSVSWYVNSVGSLWFVGELKNTGDIDLASIEVIVSLKLSDGSLTAVESGYTELELVHTNEVAPFSVLFSGPPKEWDDYEVDIQVEEASSFDYAISYRDFEIVESSGKTGEFSAYEVVGQIQNVGEKDAEFVEVMATLYDAEGKVVGVGTSYTKFDVVKAGQTSPFSIEVISTARDIDHYALVAESHLVD